VIAARRAPRQRALLAALALAAGCAAAPEPAPEAAVSAAGGALRPAACRTLPAGAALQAELDAAPAGLSLRSAPGRHAAPVRIDRALTLWGPSDAVIRSSGEGTSVRLEGEGAALLGSTVDGSGGRFELLDAAVHVSGEGGRVEGVLIRNAVFGILVERASRVTIRDNRVLGDPDRPLGLRGDGIRLWEAYDSRIEGNLLSDSRDVVLWYASRNRLARNRIEHGRYGAHLMYSHGNQIDDNVFVGNVTGLFVMYSRDVDVRGNLIADSGGAAGMGLGLKESGNLRVQNNLFAGNTVGAYLDTSPFWPDDRNLFQGNLFRLNDVAVSFLGRASSNEFAGNGFRDNQVQVQVDGRGDARQALWRGNQFDDYAGYDLDGDGTGDVPYELRSLSSDLLARAPALAFYRGTPALALAEAIGRIVPLFEPRLLLSDSAPRMRRVVWEAPRADRG
jgi:nitrous oxidase accessory protein